MSNHEIFKAAQNGKGQNLFSLNIAHFFLLTTYFSLLTSVGADTHYVSLSGSNTPPYTNWAEAATNIQDAIDAASVGDTVWVTNGIYDTGGRTLLDVDWAGNRVAVTGAMFVAGVNGPSFTRIVGTNGMRCAYVANGAVLSGFTLAGGCLNNLGQSEHANGGGAYCEGAGVISNCVITGCRLDHGGSGGGVFGGTAVHCVMNFNMVEYGNGGGMAHGLAVDCAICENSGYQGGGTAHNTNMSCLIDGNHANSVGGGTVFSANRACRIIGNDAENGGGTWAGENVSSAIMGNQCLYGGGGSSLDVNRNCTIIDNVADLGGGTSGSTNYNCIVYYNSARLAYPNWQNGCLGYSCTTPLPEGEGNLTSEPALMGLRNPRLLAPSPCRDAGSDSLSVWATDLDGGSRT
ncbi:MAG: hypothetical protein V2A34_10265, partial [Lentisphaerota bacterium]